MRFEIPFDEKISRECSEKHFAILWKDFLRKNKKNLYMGIPYIIIGTFVVYGKSDLGYIFIILGIYCLYIYWKNENRYKDTKIQNSAIIEKHILEYSSHNKSCIMEFNEDKFYYSDFKYDLKISWSSFTKFKIIDNNLLLELRDNVIANFFLNKEEVGSENFDKIIHFLEGKIKNK